MKYIILLILLGFGLTKVINTFSFKSKNQVPQAISITNVDPLEKVLKNQDNLPGITALADAARGEYATFQLVLQATVPLKGLKVSYQAASNGSSRLTTAKVGYVGYVKLNNLAGRSSARDQIRAKDRLYPDPIFTSAPAMIPANSNQSVWLSIPIPAGQAAGLYTGKVIFEGWRGNQAFKQVQEIKVNVYPVNITQNTLLSSNWLFSENRLSPPSAKLKYMNGGKEVVPYSARYWELLEVVAKNMQAYRQNVLYVSPLRESSYALKNGQYTFDFSNFDRFVSLFKRYGVAKYIEGGHLGGRNGGWGTPFVLSFMNPDEQGVFQLKNVALQDAKAKGFYAQFIPALVRHLKEKGWYSTYYQHLIDEPGDDNAAGYNQVSRLIKSFAPDMKIIDALSTKEVSGNINVWVPQLDYLAANAAFFQDRIKKGESVWLYTSWLPQGEFANRFIELPLLKNRMLSWICFKYNLKGNLNWGYNYWSGDPYANADIKEGESVLPGGDSWIVYPTYGGLRSSIRQEAQRDGSLDFELLSMLHKKNPARAKQLSGAIIQSYSQYNLDIPHFRAVKKDILKSLLQ